MNNLHTFDDIGDLKLYLESTEEANMTYRVPMEWPLELREAPEVDISLSDVLYVAERAFHNDLLLVAQEDVTAIVFTLEF